MTTRVTPTLSLPWLGLWLLACSPGAFDVFDRGGGSGLVTPRDAGADTGAFDADTSDADTSAPPDAEGPEEPGADAREDAGAMDGGDAGDAGGDAGDAGSDAGEAGNDAQSADADAMPPDAPPTCPEGGAPRPLHVPMQVTTLATLTRPAGVQYRGAGPSAWLGTTRLWVFPHTTLVTPETTPPPERPFNYPSFARDGASTPWTSTGPVSSWQLGEVLDPGGAPKPLLSLTPEEYAKTVSLNVAALIRDPQRERGGLMFVWRAVGFFADNSEVGVARIDDGGEQAQRLSEPLFRAPDPLFGTAAYVDRDYVKLFSCSAVAQGAAFSYPCVVARAPVARMLERLAYEVYVRDAQGNGSWSTDLTKGTPVIDASAAGFSISWNPYLRKYLAVHGIPFENQLVLQTAAAIEGPWQERAALALPMPKVSYHVAAREQSELAQRCGQRIFITAFSPTTVFENEPRWGKDGEVALYYLDLE